MKQNHLHIMPDAKSLIDLIVNMETEKSNPRSYSLSYSLSDLIELDLLILEQSPSVISVCVRYIENQNYAADWKDRLTYALLERVRYNCTIEYHMICEEAMKLKPYPPQVRFEDVCGLVMASKTGVRIYLTNKCEIIKNFIEEKKDEINQNYNDIQIHDISSLIAYIRDMDIGSEKSLISIKTPHGNTIKIPRGSTVVDFAYKIHTDVGNCCSKATVNGIDVPLDTVLNNNDLVNITKNLEEKENPNLEWVSFVQTAHARKKIKQWHKIKNINEGKDLIDRAFEGKYFLYGDILQYAASQFNCENVDKLFEKLGSKEIDIHNVVELVARYVNTITPTTSSSYVIDEQNSPIQYYDGGVINDFNINDNHISSISIAYCCSPMPGQDIVGILNQQHKKMIVHNSNCRKINNILTENQKKLKWNCKDCTFSLKIVMIDREGILSNIISKFKEKGISYNIRSISPSVQIDYKRRSVAKIYVLVREINKIDIIKKELENMNDICQVIVKGIYPGTWKFKYD